MKKIIFLGLLAAGSIAFAPVSFGETPPRNPSYTKTNIYVGDGVYAPVLEVKSPDGEISHIKIGEQGLTRTILYNNSLIRQYGNELNKELRRAEAVKARTEARAKRQAERKAALQAKRQAARKEN